MAVAPYNTAPIIAPANPKPKVGAIIPNTSNNEANNNAFTSPTLRAMTSHRMQEGTATTPAIKNIQPPTSLKPGSSLIIATINVAVTT